MGGRANGLVQRDPIFQNIKEVNDEREGADAGSLRDAGGGDDAGGGLAGDGAAGGGSPRDPTW